MGNGSTTTHGVTIDFNFNNGTPIWTVTPNSLRMPPGNSPIDWNLTGAGATFPNSGGIVFPAPGPGSKNPKAWPGTTPAPQGSNQNKYRADDDNKLKKGDPPEVFQYTITVMHGGQAFTHDPDVTNDPPTGGGGDEDPEPMQPTPRPD